MFCYRRYGHNEGDDPSYTQPLLYQKIKDHPSVAVLYCERLAREEVADAGRVEAMRKRKYRAADSTHSRPRSNGRAI